MQIHFHVPVYLSEELLGSFVLMMSSGLASLAVGGRFNILRRYVRSDQRSPETMLLEVSRAVGYSFSFCLL